MTSSRNLNSPLVDGAFLIEEKTLLPEPSPHDSVSIGNGWARISNNLAFQNKLAAAGWTFFYMAGTIRMNVVGFDRPRTIQTAVNRLLAAVIRQKCNCLEIDHITMRSFCGMPFVTVLAHSRHIQQERSFFKARA
jgi:hypothetical protein